ncbi:glycerophosphodiester phosphodiesterase [Photobacterium aphoticum]|uniref:glycerophosphodiester phosphodiesterase n=1 Tax=Photobacterium aphoticum TaxID=754436 RepID=UPI0009E4116D|nr:glycerophosphodiester phosphodiesterase family protein [Photobacterium aphoticum]PSU60108.1 hypothetical protein C9I90_00310 [Photobacterium aphoticum]GHA33228.1 hypothetical protein GCM10007086_03100 [Photobacterium aphoticum]
MLIRQIIYVALIGATLAGCAGGSSVTLAHDPVRALSHFPNDAEGKLGRNLEHSEEELIDIQQALADRNLYLTLGGDIGFFDQNCPVNVSAHRGDFRHTENSVSSLEGAILNGYEEAELDVQANRDGSWVAYHDAYTGKAVGRWDGKRYRISTMSNSDWIKNRVRDTEGNLTEESPIFASGMINTWSNAIPGQTLNIEIKGDPSHDDLRYLNNIVRWQLEEGSYYFSSMEIEHLEYLRKINPNAMMAYLWDPDPQSIEIAKRDLRRAVKSDVLYQRNRRYIDLADDYSRRRYKNDAKLSAAEVRQKLGPNSGLYVDIRSFERHPTIEQRAREQGLKLATYTINSDEYHRERLAYLAKRGRPLPDTVIVDSTKFATCISMEPELVTNKGEYRASTVLGQMIAKLPNDADFSQLELQKIYMADNHYLSYKQQVRSIYAKETVAPRANSKRQRFTEVIIKDVEMDVLVEPIIINLPD